MFSNQTPNYGLPQYEQNDTLNVLSDFNGAMETIDSTMKTNELAAASAQSKADGADTKANNNATAIGDLQTAQGADRTDINTLTGAVNTINSLIGNGVPTTDDKTIIGAINEIHSDVEEMINTPFIRKRAESVLDATVTRAVKIASLLPAITALTDEEKMRSFIIKYTPSNGRIAKYSFRRYETNSVKYDQTTCTTNGIYDAGVEINNGVGWEYDASITASGFTGTDRSSDTWEEKYMLFA